MSDRLRKFFRIRGKTGFVLDEVVAPVVLVQDLTEGPYQAGVTPGAGTIRATPVGAAAGWAFVLMLNDKLGSVIVDLGPQFKERSFSVTYAEIQNITLTTVDLGDIRLRLATRAQVLAAGVPDGSAALFSIQENDGSLSIPVELFIFNSVTIAGSTIWRGILGDNTNTLGSGRVFDNLKPAITLGPDDALIFQSDTSPLATSQIGVSVRGFYQEQPA